MSAHTLYMGSLCVLGLLILGLMVVIAELTNDNKKRYMDGYSKGYSEGYDQGKKEGPDK